MYPMESPLNHVESRAFAEVSSDYLLLPSEEEDAPFAAEAQPAEEPKRESYPINPNHI